MNRRLSGVMVENRNTRDVVSESPGVIVLTSMGVRSPAHERETCDKTIAWLNEQREVIGWRMMMS